MTKVSREVVEINPSGERKRYLVVFPASRSRIWQRACRMWCVTTHIHRAAPSSIRSFVRFLSSRLSWLFRTSDRLPAFFYRGVPRSLLSVTRRSCETSPIGTAPGTSARDISRSNNFHSRKTVPLSGNGGSSRSMGTETVAGSKFLVSPGFLFQECRSSQILFSPLLLTRG